MHGRYNWFYLYSIEKDNSFLKYLKYIIKILYS